MYWTGLYRAVVHAKRWKTKVILYHDVEWVSNDFLANLNVSLSPDVFEEHIKFFKRHYNIISLIDLVDRMNEGKKIPNALVITFDDGLYSFKKHAMPTLEKHGVPSTMFLITGVIDNEWIMWRHLITFLISKYGEEEIAKKINSYILQNKIGTVDDLADGKVHDWFYRNYSRQLVHNVVSSILTEYEIDEAELAESSQLYMSYEDIEEVPNHLVAFGSHSVSHPIFSKLKDTEIKQELLNSYELLHQNVKADKVAFSYPFGVDDAYSEISDRFIREHSRYFCSLKVGGENSWETSVFDLKRIDVHAKSKPELFTEIELIPWLKSIFTSLPFIQEIKRNAQSS